MINEKDLPRQPVGFSFTTRVRMGDFEGELQVTGASLNDVRKAVRLLPEAGIEPARATAWQTTPEGAPMRKRERQGDTWYSHNAGAEGEDLWCRGYPGKDSPGYER